jgi:2-polyprenyl-3-methyl-5-hydroxy-6-metoxy-1,4-benzoquinol methylase
MSEKLYDDLWSQSGWRGAIRLGPANRMRHSLMTSFLEKLLTRSLVSKDSDLLKKNEVKICDFGCGDGALLETFQNEWRGSKQMNKVNLKFYGCDLSSKAVSDLSRAKIKFDFFQGDLSSDTFALPEKFDIAICSEVLEHVPSSEKALSNIAKNLKPGGTLLLSVPSGPIFSYDKKVGHLRHFTSAMLQSQMTACGFTNIKIVRHGFPVHTFYKFGAHFLPSSKQDQMMAMSEPSRPALMALDSLYKLMMISRIPVGGLQLFALGTRR